MSMPYWQLLGLHVVMMVGLAATFTPVFTLGLGALPMHLYSHGSSIFGTLQQVAAAFGTALAVTVMTMRAEEVVGAVEAQLEGTQVAFALSALVSLEPATSALGSSAALVVGFHALAHLGPRPHSLGGVRTLWLLVLERTRRTAGTAPSPG